MAGWNPSKTLNTGGLHDMTSRSHFFNWYQGYNWKSLPSSTTFSRFPCHWIALLWTYVAGLIGWPDLHCGGVPVLDHSALFRPQLPPAVFIGHEIPTAKHFDSRHTPPCPHWAITTRCFAIIRVDYPSFLCLLDHWHKEFKVASAAATAARSVELSRILWWRSSSPGSWDL